MSDAVKYFQKNGFQRSKELVEMGVGFVSLESDLSFHTEQLKQIVEAHEIICLFKSLEHAKAELKACEKSGHSEILVKLYVGVGYIWASRVKQAIAEVESCMEVSNDSN